MSHHLFMDLANDAAEARERRNEAMALTNAALAVCEMHNANREQILDAQTTLERALRMRPRGSVDYAYSLINLSIARYQAARYTREPDRSRTFTNCVRGLDQARKLFRKHHERIPLDAYYGNLADVLSAWLQYEVRRTWERSASLPNETDPEYDAELGSYAALATVNPSILGLDETPEWVPQLKDSISLAIKSVPQLRANIEKISRYVAQSELKSPRVAVKLFQIQTILAPLDGHPPIPYSALDTVWEEEDYEQYSIWAIRISSWEGAQRETSTQYTILLQRLAWCLSYFRRHWSIDQINRLMSRNPLSFRLAACELARLGNWEFAFHLLESSRGLVASGSQQDFEVRDHNDLEVAWFHVTHSPRATYIVKRCGDEYFGREFCELSGEKLASLFLNLVGDNLLLSQDSDRRATSRSAMHICEELAPIADWISKNSDSRVALMPGGLYQAFPIWSVGALASDVFTGSRLVSSAPSRSLALRFRHESEADATVDVLEACDVAGSPPLQLGRLEPYFIQDALNGKIDIHLSSASFSALRDALQDSRGILHFSGHSRADLDPYDSFLLTYGAQVTVRDLLRLPIMKDLVFLGSCQSGLARNLMHQDEFLSLQTALYYGGARCVVGTLWPISDAAALAFSVRFYRYLSKFLDFRDSAQYVRRIQEAHSYATSWLKNASRRDVNELFTSPENQDIFTRDLDELAFNYYDWAAYAIVGVC
ncbi:CHAT domain-containing protein [Gordonia sp. (in: high G+C Gram-positive bacteria)]|uniref:CHAT domain-containing protein n=1 Tax=Gordonia sp. (in: high G+C Gram-positive bacteria) TaxID=84139 RepID=UPI0039E5314A